MNSPTLNATVCFWNFALLSAHFTLQTQSCVFPCLCLLDQFSSENQLCTFHIDYLKKAIRPKTVCFGGQIVNLIDRNIWVNNFVFTNFPVAIGKDQTKDALHPFILWTFQDQCRSSSKFSKSDWIWGDLPYWDADWALSCCYSMYSYSSYQDNPLAKCILSKCD